MARLRRADLSAAGYRRRRRGSGFSYLDADGTAVTGQERERVRALAIPPAWREVWISRHPDTHIQVVGVDDAGRRQYLYHPRWQERMARRKYDRALDLAGVMPTARGRVTADLRGCEPLGREQVLATAFRLLQSGAFRVGGEQYATRGALGLATLRVEHVSMAGDRMTFRFTGKSGQAQCVERVDAEAAAVVAQLVRRPSQEDLLAWCAPSGEWRRLGSRDVNDYVRAVTAGDFTAKDFRTLAGTTVAATNLAMTGPAETRRAHTQAVRDAVAEAAVQLGNTPAVARASYVDPRVVDRYAEGEVLELTRAPESALRRLILRD